MLSRVLVLLALLGGAMPAAARQGPSDGIALLLAGLERAALAGDRAAVAQLGLDGENTPGLFELCALGSNRPAGFIIKARDQSPLENGQERLLLEVFVQYGIEARIATWQLDVSPVPAAKPAGWIVARAEQLSFIGGLHRLSLNPQKQFDVRNLTIEGPDLRLELPAGSAFVAETPEGTTAVVLLGRGRMRFSPDDVAEQTQLRIFSGESSLNSEFDRAFLRVRPGDFVSRFTDGTLQARAVSARDLERARDVFEEYIGRTLLLDLTDLSRERWSLTPSAGDLIAEVRTREFGTLTYARAGKDAEDVSLFDRRRRRNISIYASDEKLAARGRSFSEDDSSEYDIVHHDIEAAFQPERLWIDARSRMLVRVRAYALTTITLRLAEPLTVRSIVSPELGRLLHLRIVGQNSVIVNLPGALTRDTEFRLQVIYSGRIEPQTLEREAVSVASGSPPQDVAQEALVIRLEPQWLYSNRSYWHPQGMVTDFATARLRISVPPEFDVVATGSPAGPAAAEPGPVAAGQRPRKVFVFDASHPSRYFACLISRFTPVVTAQLNVASAPETAGDGGGSHVVLQVVANPRQAGRARSLAERATAIFEYYASLLGSAPYPSFTLAIAEAELPGGHSPPYFAVVNQTLPMSPLQWRNDPVSFDNYPSFFLAHELAHQWWGQAVGWKNYHEQWISEGFAQYFAALYAARDRGDGALANVMRQMRRWAVDQSAEGPVYLGYRLGHIKGDGRVFRAIIYNKAAVVLHMLRRWVGDEVFFGGVRRFYETWRYRKAGTEDFRAAMQAAGAGNLEEFFEAWIYGTTIPQLRFSYQTGAASAIVRLEHRGAPMPLPVTVTVTYTSGQTEDHLVAVAGPTAELTIPLKAPVRDIQVNRDNGALAEFTR